MCFRKIVPEDKSKEGIPAAATKLYTSPCSLTARFRASLTDEGRDGQSSNMWHTELQSIAMPNTVRREKVIVFHRNSSVNNSNKQSAFQKRC